MYFVSHSKWFYTWLNSKDGNENISKDFNFVSICFWPFNIGIHECSSVINKRYDFSWFGFKMIFKLVKAWKCLQIVFFFIVIKILLYCSFCELSTSILSWIWIWATSCFKSCLINITLPDLLLWKNPFDMKDGYSLAQYSAFYWKNLFVQ